MPHCVIEYSKSLERLIEPQALINAVQKGAVASALFDESHIKTRLHPCEYYKTGISDNAFLHVTASILSGRSIAQKAELSRMILEQLERLPISSVVITVQICDIETESYAKAIL